MDELVLEDAPLHLLRVVAVHPAHLLGPGPIAPPQEGDAQADLRVPLAPGILLDHEEPGAAGHAGGPDHGGRHKVPAGFAEDGLSLLAEGDGHALVWGRSGLKRHWSKSCPEL